LHRESNDAQDYAKPALIQIKLCGQSTYAKASVDTLRRRFGWPATLRRRFGWPATRSFSVGWRPPRKLGSE